MMRAAAMIVMAGLALGGEPAYQLSGRLMPKVQASVSIYGTTTPFARSTLSDVTGHFTFRGLAPGAYTVVVFVRAQGGARKTVEIGPGSADKKRRVEVALELDESDFAFGDVVRRNSVPARELTIPKRAAREYQQAQKDLAKRAIESAQAHLEKAVEIAPQFEAAWNNLGTIAYQLRQMDRAEECFRRALAENPNAYEALINLGGVLVTLRKPKEARDYNERAARLRPNDALANSQLGLTYFQLREWDLAEQYLERAVELDPAHFSHPQLLLARIHMRRNERRQAATDLESFLIHHPDWPEARQVRQTIANLRQ